MRQYTVKWWPIFLAAWTFGLGVGLWSEAHAQALTPQVTAAAANNKVLKATPGMLFSVQAVNGTATAGFLLLFNATSAPVDGAVTPLACAPLPASGSVSVVYTPRPAAYNTGITAVVSSGANCFTKTTGVITGFIGGTVE